jgi:hypothetical protein
MIQLRSTFALGLAVGALAFAQELQIPDPPPLGHPGPDTVMAISGSAGPTGDFVYIRSGMGMQKLVKGAPYTAQASTEFTQTLADGNRIHHVTSASMARDSEGRTRREESIGAIGPMAAAGPAPKSIFIHDPVAGTSYVLEAESHTAHMMQPKNAKFEMGGASVTVEGVAGTGNSAGVAFHTKIADEKIHTRMQGAEVKTEDLGTQVMEGLSVQGKRITHTIPAGHIGNDLPIQVVTETWYSPELQTTVMSKTNDPRSGQTVYQLTNVSRAEPDPALFQVPADYKVTQGDEIGKHGMRVVLKEE